MLCLSCIVVFCTIYVLILPAITLEKKTTCEEEQSAIQEEQNLVQEEDESIVQSDDSDEVNLYRASQLKRKPMTSKMSRSPKTRKKRWTLILLQEKKMPL